MYMHTCHVYTHQAYALKLKLDIGTGLVQTLTFSRHPLIVTVCIWSMLKFFALPLNPYHEDHQALSMNFQGLAVKLSKALYDV